MTARWWQGIVPAAVALLLISCAGKEEYQEEPVDVLYNKGVNRMEEGDYKGAAKAFEEVERQHPYSKWATKAQLMSAYAFYQANEYDDALGALDRFISLHPANQDIAYAYYLRALCYYERISDVGRDQAMTLDARQAFEELIRRFPDSEYARDARIKLDLTIDHLAGKEMEIGRFYQRGGWHLAAINRFSTVVDEYQTTTHVPEALLRLSECYRALGMDDQAQKAAAVLGYNFPDSEWYQDAYAMIGGSAPIKRDTPWYQFW